MKNKHLFTPPPSKKYGIVAALGLGLLLSTSCGATSQPPATQSSTEATQESEKDSNLTPIVTGPIYQAAMQIDLSLILQESDSSLHVTRDVADKEAKKEIRKFFWDIVQLMQESSVWDSYSSMSCTFFYNNNIEFVSISNYNDILNFNSSHIGASQDQNISDLFSTFYYSVFGAHDSSVLIDKNMYDLAQEYGTNGYALPAEYRNGYLWVYANFDSSCGYTVSDESISVQVISSGSSDNGRYAALQLEEATSLFNEFYNRDNLSMPYTKISVQYIDILNNSQILWDWCSEKKQGNWDVTINKCNNLEFANGIKSAANTTTQQ